LGGQLWADTALSTGEVEDMSRAYERGSSRYIVPGPDSYGGARDWRNIWVFVTNKLGIK